MAVDLNEGKTVLSDEDIDDLSNFYEEIKKALNKINNEIYEHLDIQKLLSNLNEIKNKKETKARNEKIKLFVKDIIKINKIYLMYMEKEKV